MTIYPTFRLSFPSGNQSIDHQNFIEAPAFFYDVDSDLKDLKVLVSVLLFLLYFPYYRVPCGVQTFCRIPAINPVLWERKHIIHWRRPSSRILVMMRKEKMPTGVRVCVRGEPVTRGERESTIDGWRG